MNIPISYNWLRAHFEKDIPRPEEISALFMKHLCEVEGMEEKSGDTIFDLKILPDRGHDLLCHKGIAGEISVLTGIPLKEEIKFSGTVFTTAKLNVSVADNKLCPRYMGRIIEGVHVAESPAWLRERLESVGQRSINNVVDVTNYVMLELGQPMHAFDASKLSKNNDIVEVLVRPALSGESITTLDGKNISLTPETLVVADANHALAVAGVKGGKDAGVDTATINIVLEAANFNAVNVRKTSHRVGIRTDSSKRFEHDISSSLAEDAMSLATALLVEMCPSAKVGEVVDVYPLSEPVHKVEFSVQDLNGILGIQLSEKEISEILVRLGFLYETQDDVFVVTAPSRRLDLRIKEDLVEEVGRVYGFDKVEDAPIPEILFTPRPLKAYYYANVIRDVLVEHGFSEVYTYAFQNEGVFKVKNPIAEDKGFLRKNLTTGIQQSLVLNARNAPLLALDEIKIFEIGKIFPEVMEEKWSLAIGVEVVKNIKKKDTRVCEVLDDVKALLSSALGFDVEGIFAGGVLEIDLEKLLDVLPVPKVGAPFVASIVKYEKPSAYPFVLRDIALWVPESISSDVILNIITQEGGELVRVKRLFDTFTKEFPEGKKTSYAFNLVFQSYEKTLSDDEVNMVMEKIQSTLTKKGFEVR